MAWSVADLTSDMNVSDNAGDSTSSAPHALTNIEKSLQSTVESVSARSAAIVGECRQLKEKLTKAQKEHETLREQRQCQNTARTVGLPKARWGDSAITCTVVLL